MSSTSSIPVSSLKRKRDDGKVDDDDVETADVDEKEKKDVPPIVEEDLEALEDTDARWVAQHKKGSKKLITLRTNFPPANRAWSIEWISYDVPMWKHIASILKQVTGDEPVQWTFQPAHKRVYMQRMDTANTSTIELCFNGPHTMVSQPRHLEPGKDDDDKFVFAISNTELNDAVQRAKPTDRLRMFVTEGKKDVWNVWSESLTSDTNNAEIFFPLLCSDVPVFDTEVFLDRYNVMFEVEAAEWHRWIVSLKKYDTIIRVMVDPQEKKLVLSSSNDQMKSGMKIQKQEATYPIRILAHHKHPSKPLPDNVVCQGMFSQPLCQTYSPIYRVGKPGDKIKISMSCDPYERHKVNDHGRPVYHASDPLLIQYDLCSDRLPNSFDRGQYEKIGWMRVWIAPKITDDE